MLENMPFWVYGTAAVIDTVLLFALVERHNWRAVTVWMLLLALGVWCWHGGTFVRFLVDQSVGPLANPVRWLATVSMAFGILLMPSAAVHGTCRLLKHKSFRISPRVDLRLACCYLPLLLLWPIALQLASDPSGKFPELLKSFHVPYATWLCLVSGFTAFGLIRIGVDSPEPPIRRFYYSLAASMVLIALLTTTFIAIFDRFPVTAGHLQNFVGFSPIIPVLLFSYFVMRFQLLPLILERTLVYGAVLIGIMLFHAVVLKDAVTDVATRYQLDLGVVEGMLALAIILLYQPLRDRVSAALQSLLDASNDRRSDRQRLAVQLATRAGDSVSDLLVWFTSTMQSSFGTDRAAAWLRNRDGEVLFRAGRSELLDEDHVAQILATMSRTGDSFISRYSAADPQVLAILDRIQAGAALRFQHAHIEGLFLIGCRHWGQPPTAEDLHSLSLLVEQFGITLHNSQLQLLQVAAEHRVFQQEKLSALGLLAGSLAHEIKNPLSSIKTITRVMVEEFGPDSPYAEDLRMIGDEIDRLAASTSELLEAARPARADRPPVPLTELLSPTLRLLQYLAQEHKTTLQVSFPDKSVIVPLDQTSLREILFNLISNGLESAGNGGLVQLVCRLQSDLLVIEVHDNGPGITADQQSRIFDPFFTTKPTGTGLGLFVVARRVRELGGQIECSSDPNRATIFRLQLPIQAARSLEENGGVR